MKTLYNIGILLFTFLVRAVAPFNRKARLWVGGRKGWAEILKNKIKSGSKYIWIHCASLGEFEQGRPVIETIKKEKPQYKIVITFFSPSGYETRKNYQHADIICYLPSDKPSNAQKFISITDPVMAIFVKYEFWYNYISELNRRSIPLFLISGIFRKEQHFFKWYGSFFRRILEKFTTMYVQDQQSLELLKRFGLQNVAVAGDTRFDRVTEIAGQAKEIPQLEQFRGMERLFLAGSSWKHDDEIIAAYINRYPDKMKWVFAPHEIDVENIERLERLLNVKHIRFSGFDNNSADARVLIIDNIGMLSSAYRYAYIAEVGGGFGKGIHNILEPACWNIPVLFGPNYYKFREAVEMINVEGAFSFSDYDEFEAILERWLSSEKLYFRAAESAGRYVKENTGATDKILKSITLD
jgi:3-deoxy-D-manno-octulosonic-acid transferase